jgi:hypothetical protein
MDNLDKSAKPFNFVSFSSFPLLTLQIVWIINRFQSLLIRKFSFSAGARIQSSY